MKRGIAIKDFYNGPKIDALEFSLHDKNKDIRLSIARGLLAKTNYISAHLPSFLPIENVNNEVAFDDGTIKHFVAHITKRSKPNNWKDAWKDYVKCEKKILFENHNLDWHETDTGLCWPEEFKSLVDAGYSLCLDVGHILQASSFRARDESHWRDMVEKHFENFLQLPIEAVHVHTMNRFQGMDHYLDGFEIKPWLDKIRIKYPETVFYIESPFEQYSLKDKLEALNKWLPIENEKDEQMNFEFRHVNRITYPQKHVLICEDDTNNQKRILEHFSQIFDPQGLVQFSVVPGGLAAAAIMNFTKIDLIILDHDMPQGNGTDLIVWLIKSKSMLPIITFSGIPENNIHMVRMGAHYLFNKEEVIAGKADKIIKGILGFNVETKEEPKNEEYINTLYDNNKTSRYFVEDKILVGGSILDENDWNHLKTNFGIDAVLNVETEHSDAGKGIDELVELRVPDDGSPFPPETVNMAAMIGTKWINEGKKIYVHCQMGGSRSPAFAYLLLRTAYTMNPQDALKKIREFKPEFGDHDYHKSYIKSIEAAL